jgi:hypothetical protein
MDRKTTIPEETHQGWLQSSTCRAVEAAGREAGHAFGLAESMARTLARLLNRQARQKFGSADAAGLEAVNALAQASACEQLLELADRLVKAASWDDWLEGVAKPPPTPGLPEYARNVEIGFERSEPSIDTHARATLQNGEEAIIHLRIQKWYQPDLDRHLFEASRKLERKFGRMPMVVVFLMWPPAEGPGTTGRFEERDAGGKVERVFTYTIKRAWEIEPEEAVRSPGTMLLAPLTRGARQRMAEIVRMVKVGLENCKADARTREMVWDAVYWSMGLICDLEDCHRALGDLLPMIQSSANYLSVKGQAFRDGHASAQLEGPPKSARALVLRQATARFGAFPGMAQALETFDEMEDLEAISQRVFTAGDWDSVLPPARN